MTALGRSERWPELRRAGREFVEQERSWAVSAARYRPVFERLAGQVA